MQAGGQGFDSLILHREKARDTEPSREPQKTKERSAVRKKKKEQNRSHPGAEAPGLCPAARRAEETIDMLKTKKDENVEYESARGGGLTSRRVGEGKESKGGRWIPRLQEAKKDVASDEMPWGGASGL